MGGRPLALDQLCWVLRDELPEFVTEEEREKLHKFVCSGQQKGRRFGGGSKDFLFCEAHAQAIASFVPRK